ncbi:MAG: hypothetical protein QXL94_08355, partial [Candidatus Parvarchaeum sp.]
MTNKNVIVLINSVIILTVIFVSFLGFGNSNGFSCYDHNITLVNASSFICTYQWVNINEPISIKNENIFAKGIFINNTFSITGNSTLNASIIINKGNTTINATLLSGISFENYGSLVLERPIFINFSYFLNQGQIINKNYLDNGGYSNGYMFYDGKSYGVGGESYPFSYAGSGGGSVSYSAANGGNTLVKGGSGEMIGEENYPVIYYDTKGNHVYSSPYNYSFNLSLLSSAGGAAYNGVNNSLYNLRGGSGVAPLIIISKLFNNTGIIYNQGQSINYSSIKNASKFLDSGIVGAGGGGVAMVISASFVNNGTFNLSGGKIYLNESIALPYYYNKSDLGEGGYGNVFFFKANPKLLSVSIHNWGMPQNISINKLNTSKLNISNISYESARNYSISVNVQSIQGC